jgi:hypothetical protein
MGYVNIPDMNLHGTIAKLIGKMQGNVMSKVLQNSTNITNSLNRQGCPTENETNTLRKKLNQNKRALSQVSSRISKFKSIPSKLKAPLGGLKAAYQLILALPIPQGIGIPPGPAGGLILGLPINVTTKYADTMHLLKELIKQIDEQVGAITAALSVPSSALKSLTRNLGAADSAIKCCEVEAALNRQIKDGRIKYGELQDLGLGDDDGNLIFSTLGPRLLSKVSNDGLSNSGKDSSKNKGDLNKKGKWIAGICYQLNDKVTHNGVEYIYTCKNPISSDGTCEVLSSESNQPPDGECWMSVDDATNNGNDTLIESLRKLDDSNINNETKELIRSFLDSLKSAGDGENANNANFFHTGPDGTVYELQIKDDPNSPTIAPRRFAVAIDPSGVAVLTGEKSFSSSVQVLLDEIKFRIDNQLP